MRWTEPDLWCFVCCVSPVKLWSMKCVCFQIISNPSLNLKFLFWMLSNLSNTRNSTLKIERKCCKLIQHLISHVFVKAWKSGVKLCFPTPTFWKYFPRARLFSDRIYEIQIIDLTFCWIERVLDLRVKGVSFGNFLEQTLESQHQRLGAQSCFVSSWKIKSRTTQ